MLETHRRESDAAVCPDGGTGRRAGLKIRFSQESGSSTLPPGTTRVAHESQTEDGWSSLTSHSNPLDLFFRLAYSPAPSVMKINDFMGHPSSCPVVRHYIIIF